MDKIKKTLASFIAYCEHHPQERFWQALRNWAGFQFIYVTDFMVEPDTAPVLDTFNFEERDH